MITSSHVDSMMEQRRNKEEKMSALHVYSAQNVKLQVAAQRDVDITSLRRKERLARVQAEERMQSMIQEAELAARQQQRINDQNQKLAGEVGIPPASPYWTP